MNLDRSVRVWPQIADELRRRLIAGRYKPGERFPGTVAIAAEFDVSQSTAQKAVAALRAEKRLRTVLGKVRSSSTRTGPSGSARALSQDGSGPVTALTVMGCRFRLLGALARAENGVTLGAPWGTFGGLSGTPRARSVSCCPWRLIRANRAAESLS
ncbi:GntR family transcriptional regulator [Streptomyces sp. NPDC057460]|uniref:GntR family transcriptional regulator n=1 Tax=Streptomyces sp. NPDC057460 TaxID=3346141 RepID=UPI0036C05FF0